MLNDRSKRIINAVILSVAIISLSENFRLGAAQAKINSDNSIANALVEEQTSEEKWNAFLESNHYFAQFYELQELPMEKVTYTNEEITSLIVRGKCHEIMENDYWVKDEASTKDGITNLIYVRYESTSDKYFGIGIKSLKTEDVDIFLIKNSSMKGGKSSYSLEEIEAFLSSGKATFDSNDKCYYINVGSGFQKGNTCYTVPWGYSFMFQYVYDKDTDQYVKTDRYYQIEDSKGIERSRKTHIF